MQFVEYSSGEESFENGVSFENRFSNHNGQNSGWSNKGKQLNRFRLNIDNGDIQTYDQIMSYINSLEERVGRCEALLEKQYERLKTLDYRSIENEAISRRRNLIIWGVSENTNLPIYRLVLNFLEDEMAVDTSDICVERAYRLGSRKSGMMGRKRPIIVCMATYSDTEKLMRKAYMLKGSPFGIDRDYPRVIAEARKRLFCSSEAKQARQFAHNVQIKYPARLLINGKLVCDVFPHWYKYISYRIGNDNETSGLYQSEDIISYHTETEVEKGDVIEEKKFSERMKKVEMCKECGVKKTYVSDSPKAAKTLQSSPKGKQTQKKYSYVSKKLSNPSSRYRNKTHTLHEMDNTYWSRGQNCAKYRNVEIPFYTAMDEHVHIPSQNSVTRL